MGASPSCLLSSAGVEEDDVDVEAERAEGREVQDRGKAHDPPGEVREVEGQAERRDAAPEASPKDGRRARPDGNRTAGDGQHERHRGVGCQQRSDHPEGDERGPAEPVADVVGRHQPEVGTAQPEQHRHVAQRQHDGTV